MRLNRNKQLADSAATIVARLRWWWWWTGWWRSQRSDLIVAPSQPVFSDRRELGSLGSGRHLRTASAASRQGQRRTGEICGHVRRAKPAIFTTLECKFIKLWTTYSPLVYGMLKSGNGCVRSLVPPPSLAIAPPPSPSRRISRRGAPVSAQLGGTSAPELQRAY